MNHEDLRTELRSLQSEIADLGRLVAFAHERAWPASLPRCRHRHTTVVQCHGNSGWFVTHQCDDCGASLSDPLVTDHDLEQRADLPQFDLDLYRTGLDRIGRSAVTTFDFLERAARR